MSARSELFDRLKYLDAAISLPQMIDVGILPTEHNGIANLLRRGTGIVAFNILEDFIKNKSYEALNCISGSRVEFSKLTPTLQEAAILGALNALVFRSKIEKKEGKDWKTLIQDESFKIHSTKNPTYELSKFSLVSANSNISPEEAVDIIRAFGIAGGWATLKGVSDSIGGGIPDLSQAYRNAADRRHGAAHTASFRYNYQWLEGIKNEILAIASSFDILLSARCRQALANPLLNLSDHDINRALNYRFLELSGTSYRETLSIGGKARKKWSSLSLAIDNIQPLLAGRNEFLIVLNQARRIESWHD